MKTDVKSNEITAIPELLQLLEIKGSLISIDAMGCQKEIATAIVDKGGDYLLSVKGNQKKLLETIKSTFQSVDKAVTPALVEHQHGRVEVREYRVSTVSQTAAFTDWKGIQSIGEAIIAFKRR